jgi:prophage regulatory protein
LLKQINKRKENMSRFLRIKEVMNKTGIARSTIWLWVKEDKFPKPIKLSPRITVWDNNEIDKWMNNF